MTNHRKALEQKLRALPGIEITRWKETELVCLLYHGREFAHFHGDHVLDIRLSAKIIRQEGLPRTLAETRHPGRSENSRWIEVAFSDDSGVERLVHLVRRACVELM